MEYPVQHCLCSMVLFTFHTMRLQWLPLATSIVFQSQPYSTAITIFRSEACCLRARLSVTFFLLRARFLFPPPLDLIKGMVDYNAYTTLHYARPLRRRRDVLYEGGLGMCRCSWSCIATLRDLIVVPLPSYYRTKALIMYVYSVEILLMVVDGCRVMESFWFDV